MDFISFKYTRKEVKWGEGKERKGKERNGMEWNGMEWNGRKGEGFGNNSRSSRQIAHCFMLHTNFLNLLRFCQI